MQKPADGDRPDAHGAGEKHDLGRDAALLCAAGRRDQRGGAAGREQAGRPHDGKPRGGFDAGARLHAAAGELRGDAAGDGAGAARDERQHGDGIRLDFGGRDGGERDRGAAGGERQGLTRQHEERLPRVPGDRGALHRADPAVLRRAASVPHHRRERAGAVRELRQRGAAAAGTGRDLRGGHGLPGTGVRHLGAGTETDGLHDDGAERAGAAVLPAGLF